MLNQANVITSLDFVSLKDVNGLFCKIIHRFVIWNKRRFMKIERE